MLQLVAVSGLPQGPRGPHQLTALNNFLLHLENEEYPSFAAGPPFSSVSRIGMPTQCPRSASRHPKYHVRSTMPLRQSMSSWNGTRTASELGVSQKHILDVCLLFKQECWDGMPLSILPVLPFSEWCACWYRSRGRRREGTTWDDLGVAEWGCITRESREFFGVDEERDCRESGSGFCFSPTYSHIWTEYHWTEYYWTEYYRTEYYWTHHFSNCSKHSRYIFLLYHSTCAVLQLLTLMQSS